MIEIIDEICLGLAKPAEGGGGGSAVIEALSVTPTTESQTINAGSGVDGYSPVNVEAVTSSIDSNITANNIKSGITILGVAGSVEELNAESVTITPTTSQQVITPTSPHNGITSATVSAVTNAIDANITAGNIKKDVTILGVTGSYEGVTPTGTLSITTNGTYNVTNYASADVNVSGGVSAKYGATLDSLLGDVDANGVLQRPNSSTSLVFSNVSDIGEKALQYKFAGLRNINAVSFPDLVTVSGNYACYNAFWEGTQNLNSLDLSSLTTVSGVSGCQQMFHSPNVPGLNNTALNLHNLTTVSGVNGCQQMFRYTRITSLDLSNLTTVSGSYGCNEMFNYCEYLRTITGLNKLSTIASSGCSSMFGYCSLIESDIDLSGLISISTNYACQAMFMSCLKITKFDLSNLTTVSGMNACVNMFYNCDITGDVEFDSLTSLTGGSCFQNILGRSTYFIPTNHLNNVKFPVLDTVKNNYVFQMAFQYRDGVNIYFNALNSTSFGNYTNVFPNMLSGASGCTVHFPSNLQSVIGAWADVMAGFGGTNTTVLFDLTATE